ncbi:hypothetical protein GGF31_006385 [Allomyces arbusculus]|nr:hypothetical protein GGF31_006385 [Allomyces arbusculus]
MAEPKPSFVSLEELLRAQPSIDASVAAADLGGTDTNKQWTAWAKKVKATSLSTILAPLVGANGALQVTQLDDVAALPVDQNAATLLVIYAALLHNQRQNAQGLRTLIPRVAALVRAADANMLRHVPDQVVDLAKRLAAAISLVPAAAVVHPLVNLARKFALPDSITAVHFYALHACLLSHNFKAALPILATDKTTTQKPINVKDVLLYHYLGGMVYTALKRYTEACELFSFNLIAPGRGVSQIQVESYKKWTLVSLLATGRVPKLPKTDSDMFAAVIAHHARVYKDLATAFSTGSLAQFQAIMDASHTAATLRADGNYGLARQALDALARHKVQALTTTFLTLAVADLAVLADVPDVERMVAGMIADKQVRAVIRQEPTGGAAMVQFLDDEHAFDDDATHADVAARIVKVVKAAAAVRGINEAMALKGGKSGGRAGSFGVSERDMAMQAALLNSYDDMDVGFLDDPMEVL